MATPNYGYEKRQKELAKKKKKEEKLREKNDRKLHGTPDSGILGHHDIPVADANTPPTS